ncbi:MAG: hypothetical protein ACOCM4_14150 [Acetivibrio ethanolgignens]
MKIAIENFQKITNFCTAKEIDVILLLASMQNQYGEVMGVTYRQVCEEVDICKSYFYKILHSLETNGIIKIAYINEDYGTWKVTLCGNVFAGAEDYKKGYFKINRKRLFSKEFRELGTTEKVLLLNLMFMQDKKGHKFKIFMSTLCRWADRSVRTIKKAVETLKEKGLVTVIEFVNGGYSFGAKEKELGGGKAVENESVLRMKQLLSLVLRRKKIQVSETAVNDVIGVLKGFGNCLDKYIIQKLERCVEECGSLQGAYMNRVMRG